MRNKAEAKNLFNELITQINESGDLGSRFRDSLRLADLLGHSNDNEVIGLLFQAAECGFTFEQTFC